MNCPCGSRKNYKSCCGKIHKNIKKAKTAEQLMRSRYSAFVLGMGDYLFKSHHSSQRKVSEKQDIENWAKSVEWIRLDVLSASDDQVEFKAFFRENGLENFIHEKSLFKMENEHWVYFSAL